MGNPTESTYRRLFTIAKYIRLYHNSKIYQNEYNNISKYQTISLYQNISASKINITITKYSRVDNIKLSSTQQWVQLPEIYHGSHFS